MDLKITNGHHLHTLVGAASFFRRHLPRFSDVAHAALEHLRKCGNLARHLREALPDAVQASADGIKHLLVNAVTTHTPHPFRPYTIFTDASDRGWGAALFQDEHVVATASGKWSDTQS